MSVLRRLVGAERRESQVAAFVPPLLERVFSGVAVDADRAMRHDAVWSAVNFIADLISTLPVAAYRDRAGETVRLEPPPQLVRRPSAVVSRTAWSRQILVSQLLRGNAYGMVSGVDRNGVPTGVEILHPDEVQVFAEGRFGPWVFRVNGQPVERWPNGPLWHVPAFVMPGSPVGLSPVAYAAQQIGLGLAAQKFGAQFFGDGGHPSAALTTDGEVNQQQAEVIKQRFLNATRGNREPVVLGAGMRYQPIQISPEESQFLDTLQANGAQIARIYGLRPEDIGFKSGDSMTYANVEQRQIDRLVYPINQWVLRLEEAVNDLLPNGTYVKHNVDALIRVDLKTRYQVHQIALRNGVRTRNEVRDLEELPPLEGGDEPLPVTSTPPARQEDTP